MTAAKQPQATRIGPAGRAALQLLACCPRMPTNVVGVLLGHRHAVTTAQLLARRRRAGLANYQAFRLGPLLGSRPVRLWTLTADGRAFVASRGPATTPEGTGQMPYGEPERWRDPARQRDVPLLVACYRLLARVATDLDRPVHVSAWEHPWIRSFVQTESARKRWARLPAAAVLQSRETDPERPQRLLLLPDLGTAPLASYRPTLQALTELRSAQMTEEEEEEEDEAVLVVGVATSPRSSNARVQAWQSLLQEVARRADDRPLRARVFDLDCSRANRRGMGRCPPGQIDEVFALIGRHPLLTRQQLASLLQTSAGRINRLEAECVARGWLRPVTVDDDLPRGTGRPSRDRIKRLGLVELTEAGRQEAARRLLVRAGLARRRHGLILSGASRRRFVRHIHHTVGANAFFVALAAAAGQVTSRGRDDALIEWRSAAACAHGRFRPDGYGCYQRGPWRFGFFLEYDRGTEKPGQYAAKLATYYRYRDSGAYRRDYEGFPALLVLTTSELAEARFALQAYLAQQRHSAAPLSLFLTTTRKIQACREGALGPIWRSPAAPWALEPARMCWLPPRAVTNVQIAGPEPNPPESSALSRRPNIGLRG
ncbi:MAG: replication-relaxation family protein [Chloroflexota bacterium]|nr:replication-relaxation family protein [Chloroflexota bacterium]